MPSLLIHTEVQEGLKSAGGDQIVQRPEICMTTQVFPENNEAWNLGRLTVTVRASEIPDQIGLPDCTRVELQQKIISALKSSL